jgi:hypothetical protein
VNVLDNEGYTRDTPDGITVLVHWWEDYPNAWNKDIDKTTAIQIKYAIDHQADKDFTAEKDPLYGGLGGVLKRLLVINYKKQVTGANHDYLASSIQRAIDDKLRSLSAVAEGSSEIHLSLSQEGEFFAQLSSRDQGGNLFSDPNGDILRLKYVTHGNYLKFTVDRTLLGSLIDQLLDPFAVFNEGGPAFTVTFNTVTKIDVQLPHNSRQGLQILSSVIKLAGAVVTDENEDASKLINYVQVPIRQAVNDYQTDITGTIQKSLQGFSQLLLQSKFDEAAYHVNNDKLVMEFTQHPQRNFLVTIYYIDQQDKFLGKVRNYAKVRIGLGQLPTEALLGVTPLWEGYIPIGRSYSEGIRNLVISLQEWRQIINKPVKGHLVNAGGHYYAYYDDGVITDLGRDFNPNDPFTPSPFPRWDASPPVKGGLVDDIFLYVDYALQTITGRNPDNSIFKVKAGQQIRIPDDKSTVAIWFTVSMSGTRNGDVPNVQPPDPPRREPQNAIGFH